MSTQPTPATTLQEEWQKYRDLIYPQGVGFQQNVECHQAFFAGAFAIGVAIIECTDANANISEEEAAKRVAALIKEAQDVCANRVKQLKDRN